MRRDEWIQIISVIESALVDQGQSDFVSIIVGLHDVIDGIQAVGDAA